MEGVGVQSTMRYDQVIDQQLANVDDLRKTWIEGQDDLDNIRVGMAGAAKTRGYTYLALMNSDGSFSKIYYGEDETSVSSSVYGVKLADHDREAFVSDLVAGNKKVAIAAGIDKADADDPSAQTIEEGVILFAVPTARNDCAALVAGLKNDVFVDMLSKKNSDGGKSERFNTHIISVDGAIVMGSDEEEITSYEEFLRTDLKAENSQSVWSSLKSGMERMSADAKNPAVSYVKAFSQVLNTKSAHKHIYCQKLGNSEWFYVTVMDYADLDTRVHGLSNNLTTNMIVACVIILVLMSAIFVVYFLMNRSNLKQVEEARASAEEANKAKSDFLSNMSHDVRTPMNAIMGMTTIAIANIDNKEQVSDCLKKISISSRHLLSLINDMLDMSKIETGDMALNMEHLSLSEVVHGVCTIVQPHFKAKMQTFDVYVRDIITENLYSDSVRLNQIFLNLLSNAYKFTPEEGAVELSVYQEESPRGEDFVRTHIEVKDNGIGMSEEFQKQLFDSFTREDRARVDKTEGAGLGMAVTKYIIDSMQGTIDVQSKQGEGTVFHVVLDIQTSGIPETDTSDLPEWKILVVDGNKTLCDTEIAMLGSLGIKVDAAYDNQTAIEMAENAHKEKKGYDFVLTDWKQHGVNGIEIAEKLHKSVSGKILLLTTHDYSEAEDEALAAGVSGFIPKPLFRSSLYYGLMKSGSKNGGDESVQHVGIHPDLKGKRILVAEDNDINWEIADLLLSSEGIVVEHAENGQICVDKLLAHKPDFYDAILMDVRMPVMNGLEATTIIRSLRKGYNKIPIIAMTADAFAEDVQKCLACGMNAHIAKPINIEVVKATLAKYISAN